MNEYYEDILHQKDKRFKKIIRSVIKNDPDKDDIIQEFYIRFITYKELFNKLKGTQIYYYSTFVLNQIVKTYNKNNKYSEQIDVEYNANIEWYIDRDLILNNLTMLSHYERELIDLYYIQQFNYREIHEMTKIPITSLNLSIRKAIQKIKKHYGV